MGTFKDYIVGSAPPWLNDPSGQAMLRAIGDGKDYLLDVAKQGVKARFPLLAPSDALNQIGGERQLPRGPGESTASYAARLRGAWDTWPWAGTPTGVLNALWDAGYTNVWLVVQKGRVYTLNASRQLVVMNTSTDGISSFTFPSPNFWSTFLAYFPHPHPASWIANGVPSSSSDEANLIRGLIQKWKPGFSTFSRVVIADTGLLWGLSDHATVKLYVVGTIGTLITAGHEVSAGPGEHFATVADVTIAAQNTWTNGVTYGNVGTLVYAAGKIWVSLTPGTATTIPTGTGIFTDGALTWRYLGTGTGAATVNARAVNAGALTAPALSLDTIETPVTNWNAVLNLVDASLAPLWGVGTWGGTTIEWSP